VTLDRGLHGDSLRSVAHPQAGTVTGLRRATPLDGHIVLQNGRVPALIS
jgi:hypothetical protein